MNVRFLCTCIVATMAVMVAYHAHAGAWATAVECHLAGAPFALAMFCPSYREVFDRAMWVVAWPILAVASILEELGSDPR